MVSQKKMVKRVRWLTVAGVVVAILLVLGVLWAMSFQQERLQDPPVVSVNGDVIYANDVWSMYNRAPSDVRAQYSPGDILEQMIDQRLILQYAASQGVIVSDEDLQAAIDERLSFYGTTRSELREVLEEQGESYEEFEQGVLDELVFEVFVNTVLLPRITISDTEVQAFYQENIDSFSAGPGQMRIRHILVASEEQASDLRQEIIAGTDFASLASAYSLDSAPRGGDLGFISEQSPLVEPFKTVALSLEVDQVSEPVQTEFGWHLIKREEDVISLRDARQIISQELRQERAQRQYQVLLSDLRSEAAIRYYRAAQELGED